MIRWDDSIPRLLTNMSGQFDLTGGPVALVLHLLGDRSVGSFEIYHNMLAASSRESDPREGSIIPNVLYDPASEVTCHHFCNVLLVQVSPIS